jgi:hypothetical protein
VNSGKLGCKDPVAVVGGVLTATVDGVGYGGTLLVTAIVFVWVSVIVWTIQGASVAEESGTIMTVSV